MPYTVELSIPHDIGAVMAQMRTWLDHHRIEAVGFRQSTDASGVKIQVEFTNEPQATAFAKAFGGTLPSAPSVPTVSQSSAPRHSRR